MDKKYIIWFCYCLAALLFYYSFLASPSSSESESFIDYQNGNYSWPEYFNVLTPQVGTSSHSLAVVWTSELSNDAGTRARVLPTSNGYTRAEWLATGEGRLSLYQPSDYFAQMDATQGYASEFGGPADTRVINVNTISAWGYMVRGDSDITSVEDLKPGIKIAFYSGSTLFTDAVQGLMILAGLRDEDVQLIEVGSFAANTKVVIEGRADIAFTSPLAGQSYEADATPGGIRWLEIPRTQTNFEKYRKLQAGYLLQKTTSGVRSAQGIVMDHTVQTNHVRGDEDEEFVYNLIRWMDEKHALYKDKFNQSDMMTIENLVLYLESGAMEPLHDGTIRYLREKGFWKAEFQERQGELLGLAQNRIDLYQAALGEAKEKGMTPNYENKEWTAFWENYKTQHGVTRSFGEEVLGFQD